MLVKDLINSVKLKSISKKVNININFKYIINKTESLININYVPDRDKIDESSIKNYLDKLIEDHDLSIEDITFALAEDLYDIAVPKTIIVKIEQTIEDINKIITAEKSQPAVK